VQACLLSGVLAYIRASVLSFKRVWQQAFFRARVLACRCYCLQVTLVQACLRAVVLDFRCVFVQVSLRVGVL
jgi:hypothetical protein